MRRLLLGCEAGLLAGSLVGVAEALAVLSLASATSDYAALFVGAVLYSAVGLLPGLAAGALLAPLRRVQDATVWTLAFTGVSCAMAGRVALFHLARGHAGEAGLPAAIRLGLGAAFALCALVALFFGPILLTRTPLKALMRPKGTAAAWVALAGMTWIFSYAPGGPGGDGEFAPARPQPPDFPRKPDVLLIVVSGLRPDHLGAYGSPTPTSPALDSLAADAVLFEGAHSHASWTRPAWASLLGGVGPEVHGVLSATATLPDAVQTLPEVFNAAGYVTGGLVNHPDLSRGYNFQQGFDFFHVLGPTQPFGVTESAAQLALLSELHHLIERWRGGGLRVEDFFQPASEVLPMGQRFIEAQGERRWLLLLHLMEPQPPYFERPLNGRAIVLNDPADASLRDEIVSRYDDSIRAVDVELAKLLDWLRQTGRYDDTLIVITSDHGVEFLEHGGYGSGRTLYEEQLRVPLLLKLPGQHLAGTRARWTVPLADLAPTVAALAGFPPDPSWTGWDLFDEPSEAALQAQFDAARAAPLPEAPPQPDSSALDRPVLAQIAGASAWIDRGHKLLRTGEVRGLPAESLYSLEEDPREARDLAGQRIAVQAQLAGDLARRLDRPGRVLGGGP